MTDRPRYDSPTVFNFLHDYGCDMRARRVFFHHWMGASEQPHEIGVEYIVRNLLHLDKSAGTIELWLNNPGGYLSEMWGVVDVMRGCKNPVDTIAYGSVASAACLVLASGTGIRYALPSSSFMWHAGTTDVTDDMHWVDARDRMAWETRENERWIDAMAKRTTPKDVRGRVVRSKAGRVKFWQQHAQGGGEMWLDAAEMVKHGVVDRIR